jgi:uncharacterized zinc-type alcohol dehydrogenase-like protein
VRTSAPTRLFAVVAAGVGHTEEVVLMVASVGYAALAAKGPLERFEFSRREPGPSDVLIDIEFCGICHSDLHFVDNDWGASSYPLVPGHEIVGRVTETGSDVTRLRPGDRVGIGCLVDSCRKCSACLAGEEHVCTRLTTTYGGIDRKTGLPTYGGYSSNYVVDEHFALSIPEHLEPAAAAPLLCAGITTYSPLRHWQVQSGQRVGVVGLGGLGHMAIKFAKAFGAEVVVLTTSPAKADDARRLGADDVVLSTDRAQMKQYTGALDFLLDTVSANHNLNSELHLLRRDGTLCLVGVPEAPSPVAATSLTMGRRRLAGSAIGGIPETQEMLDFCAEHKITSDIELVGVADIGEAFERMSRGHVRYRSVIDLSTLD